LENQLVRGNEETWPSLDAYREAAERTRESLVLLKRGPSGNGLTLFCVARNEADLFPGFLDHYRRLGVQRFVIVDNGSTDGSDPILRSQPDVELYWTEDSYAKNNFGGLWIDGLIRRMAMDCWVLVVDIDERLVYAGCSDHPIPDLIAHLQQRRLTKLFAPMVDLYELEDGSLGFDATPDLAWHWDSGLGLKGGPRYRMAANLGLSYCPCLSKYPLVFYNRETAFANAHFPLPHYSNGAECFARLLHRKLIGRFPEKVREALAEGQHWQRGAEYGIYAQWVGSDLRSECTEPYSKDDDLVGAGLMKSINWERDLTSASAGGDDLDAERSRLHYAVVEERRRLSDSLNAMTGSISWRITAPLRAAKRLLHGWRARSG